MQKCIHNFFKHKEGNLFWKLCKIILKYHMCVLFPYLSTCGMSLLLLLILNQRSSEVFPYSSHPIWFLTNHQELTSSNWRSLLTVCYYTVLNSMSMFCPSYFYGNNLATVFHLPKFLVFFKTYLKSLTSFNNPFLAASAL